MAVAASQAISLSPAIGGRADAFAAALEAEDGRKLTAEASYNGLPDPANAQAILEVRGRAR